MQGALRLNSFIKIYTTISLCLGPMCWEKGKHRAAKRLPEDTSRDGGVLDTWGSGSYSTRRPYNEGMNVQEV